MISTRRFAWRKSFSRDRDPSRRRPNPPAGGNSCPDVGAAAALLLLTAALGTAAPAPARAQTVREIAGDVVGASVWDRFDGIYLVTRPIEVAVGATLTIQPGVIVKFAPSTGLTVRGTLVARGTADDVIHFTSQADDNVGGDLPQDGPTLAAATDWAGIRFVGEASSAGVLEHCEVWYGGGGSGADVYCNSASPSIAYCALEAAVYGLLCDEGAAPTVHDTRVDGCVSAPVALSPDSDPAFDALVLGSEKDNGFDGIGLLGGDVERDTRVPIRATRIGTAAIDNVTYVLLDRITVARGATLRLQAGLVLKAAGPAAGFAVNGRLEALGAPDSLIVLTSARDDAFGTPFDTNRDESRTAPAPGDWAGVTFADSSSGLLQSCRLRFGGQRALIEAPGRVDLTVRDCLLADGERGLSAGARAVLAFTGNDVRDCRGVPLEIAAGTALTQSGNLFRGCGIMAVGLSAGEPIESARLSPLDIGGFGGISYFVDGTLEVTGSLQIDPGVTIKFAPGLTGIRVTGALQALGLDGQRITFTSLRDDCAGNPADTEGNGWTPGPCPGDWGGLEFTPACDAAACRLSYCDLTFGGYDKIGALRLLGVEIGLDHCRFAWNLIGLQIEYFPAGIDKGAIAAREPRRPAAAVMRDLADNDFGHDVVSVVCDWGGTLTRDTVLEPITSLAGVQVVNRLSTDLVVPFGIKLTLLGGLHIGVGEAGIIVRGALIADGSEAPIDFHPFGGGGGGALPPGGFNGCTIVLGCDPSTLDPLGGGGKAADRHWKGITFENTSDDAVSLLRRVVLRGATTAVTARNASPVLRTVTIDTTGAEGIRIEGRSRPVIADCLVQHCGSVPLAMSLMSDPQTSGNSFLANGYEGIGVLGETLARDFTLGPRDMAQRRNLPYVILEDLAVGAGNTLTLSPGLNLKFLAGRRLDVASSLVAAGGASPDSLIVFTSIADDFYGGDSNQDGGATEGDQAVWGGLRLARTTAGGTVVLQHCVFRYANADDGAGALDVTGLCSPLIKDCTFARNARGVVYHEAAGDPARGGLVNCDFCGNTEYAVLNAGRVQVVRAGDCWWNDPSGPFDPSDDRSQGGLLNVRGLGDPVSDGVNYAPWLTAGAHATMLGDVSLNLEVTAYDASLVLQSLVGAVTLTASQRRLADVTCAAEVSALDAALILRVVAGLDRWFPCEADSVPTKDAAPALDLTARDATVSLELIAGSSPPRYEVRWAGTGPLLAAELTVRSDGAQIGAVTAVAGARGARLLTSPAGGTQVVIVLASPEPLAAGALVEIELAPGSSSSTVDGAPTLHLARARLNERTVIAERDEARQARPPRVVQVDNRPNPFNPATVIRFVLAGEGPARVPTRITLHDQSGRRIRLLLAAELDPGLHEVVWDGRGDAGASLASGLYFCRIEAGGQAVTRKMILLK